jgi:serpin B
MNCIVLAALLHAIGILDGEVRAMGSAESTTALVQSNTTFALDLYGRIGRGEGNRFMSPFSISCALAMTYAGAQEQTALQMASTLHFALPFDKLHPAFHQLIADLHRRNTARSGSNGTPDLELLTANALWYQKGEHILPAFQKRIESNYDGGLYPVDFQKAADLARRNINSWVEQQTRDKIKELIKPQHIDSQTVLILTNAIYFKGLWAMPFSKDRTSQADFHASSSDRVRVDMMNLTGRFRYYEEGGFQAIELPYKGDTLAMLVLLPRAKGGLDQLENSLTARKLESWIGKLSPRRVDVSLPRFRLTAEYELKQPLSEQGMPVAFDLGAADFSGITGSRGIAISAVVHKAFVEVEEKGTEAAAATGVAMSLTSAVAAPPVVFRADHPFWFAIRDTRTSSVLFLGRLARP